MVAGPEVSNGMESQVALVSPLLDGGSHAVVVGQTVAALSTDNTVSSTPPADIAAVINPAALSYPTNQTSVINSPLTTNVITPSQVPGTQL